jgi:mRNA-degrading endonuclease RelE of RelBE toxin-antitoxin system
MSYDVLSILPFYTRLKRLEKKYPQIKSDYSAFVDEIEYQPKQGKALGKNCYKVRMAITFRGKCKSGGARIITHLVVSEAIVYLLSIYDKSANTLAKPVQIAFGITTLFVIRCQMAFLYFQASVAKLYVTEWQDGTAPYYWFSHPNFGMADNFLKKAYPLLKSDFIALITWTTILFDLYLGLLLFSPKRLRIPSLKLALLFHVLTWLICGLRAFFFVMAGGLVLYLGNLEDNDSLTIHLF